MPKRLVLAHAIRSTLWGVAVLAGLGWASIGLAEESAVEFNRDVWPVLRDRCVPCHGPDKSKAGLWLDTREGWARGGYSGRSLLTTELEHNELIRRLRTASDDERMPAEGVKLSPREIEQIEAWIVAGAPWAPLASSNRSAAPIELPSPPLFDQWLEYVGTTRPAWLVALAAVLLLLASERARQRRTKAEVLSQRPSALVRGLAAIPRAVIAVSICGAVILGLSLFLRSQQEEIRQLRIKLAAPRPMAPPTTPMAPHQLIAQHPPRMGGEYYRGNDERNPRLFNGGYYRTATLSLHLIDEEGNVVEWDDTCPKQPAIELRIARAAQATPRLFSEQIMSKVALTSASNHELARAKPEELTWLEETIPGETWRAAFCIPELSKDGRATGHLFLYSDVRTEDGGMLGAPNFRIDYELVSRSGQIDRSSQLRLVSLLQPGHLIAQTEPDQILADQWFDFRPIPEIEGDPTRDEELLGIPEHEKKQRGGDPAAAGNFTRSSRNLHVSGDNGEVP